MQTIEVHADGAILHLIGKVSAVEFSTTWGIAGTPGGCELASFTFGYPAEHVPPMLRRGKVLEIHDGSGIPAWAGLISEVQRDGEVWQVHARGFGAEADRYPAFDSGATTTDADLAVAWAIGEGLPWTTPGDLFDPVLGPTETVSTNTLTDVLTYAATQQGKRWAVWADGVLYVAEDPTSPSWAASPEVLPPGVADDNYVTRLYGRYVTGLTGTPPVPSSWDLTDPVIDELAESVYPMSAKVIDYTNLGVVLDPADLEADMLNRLKLAGARMGYTNSLTLTRDVLTTLGGVHAAPAQVRAGQMLRLSRFLDVAGNLALGVTTDVVIQRTVYNHADDTVTVEPLGLVPRDLGSILAAPEAPELRGVEISG